jgi:sulfatase maturation enzyme AslB (radical SAM superfamily)
MTKIIKLVEEKQMCSLPWVHAELSLQHDNIKPCCKYRDTLGKISDGFINVWMNERSNQLRQDWVNGVHRNECSACDVSDDAFSYKKWKNKSYNEHFDFLQNSDAETPQLPSVFHFSLSNTCNLACRMCNPLQSSKLAQMTRKHTELQKYLYLQPHQKKIDIEVMRGSFKNVEHITFAGGEPVIDDDTLAVIKMIKEESTKLKVVNFSTNLTNINDELFRELCSLNAVVVLSISIDGPPHVHNYIRYHCEWDTMMKNLAYISKNYPKIRFSTNTTVSAFNVGYVTDTLDTIQKLQQEFNVNFYSLMTSPVLDKPFMHPSVLPQSVKDQYLEKINKYNKTLILKDSDYLIPTAIEMLNGKVDDSLDKFVGYVNEFDRIAGTKTTDVYPEFKAFMN